MFEFVFSLVFSLLLPITMLICGGWFVSNPPDDIGGMVGYKTKMSCINADTWYTAHKICGKVWLAFGAGNLAAAVLIFALIMVSCGGGVADILCAALIGCTAVQTAFLFIAIPVTEHRLKRIFNPDGTRK